MVDLNPDMSVIILNVNDLRCCCLVAKSHPTLLQHRGPIKLLCPWDSPGKNTGMGCHDLLQGIFLDQGLNLHLLYWQVDALPLSHQGSSQRVIK